MFSMRLVDEMMIEAQERARAIVDEYNKMMMGDRADPGEEVDYVGWLPNGDGTSPGQLVYPGEPVPGPASPGRNNGTGQSWRL